MNIMEVTGRSKALFDREVPSRDEKVRQKEGDARTPVIGGKISGNDKEIAVRAKHITKTAEPDQLDHLHDSSRI